MDKTDWMFALGIGALVVLINDEPDDPGDGDDPFAGIAVGQVRQLGFTAINAVDKYPGQHAAIHSIDFDYRGPADWLRFGWGAKPQAGFFGTDYNNGNNLISSPTPAYGNTRDFPVPASPSWRHLRFTAPSVGDAHWAVPHPDRAHTLRGGGTGEINYGGLDVWGWLSSRARRARAGLTNDVRGSTDERGLLVVAAFGDVYKIKELAGDVGGVQIGVS